MRLLKSTRDRTGTWASDFTGMPPVDWLVANSPLRPAVEGVWGYLGGMR